MSQYGNKGSANPPWARSDQSNMNQNNLGLSNQLPQSLINSNMSLPNAAATAAAAAMLYPQQQMYQGQLAAGFQQQVYNNMGTVQYPTRALNSAAFQSTATPSVQNTTSRSSGDGAKERVITGTVTKLQENFGFVDDDIFFPTSCVTSNAGNLRVGSRVLVEATFNSSMPYKWNAKRIQVLPNQTQTQNNQQQNRSTYNAVPPPADKNSSNKNFNNRNNRFGSRNYQQQNKNDNKNDYNKGQSQQSNNKGNMQGNQNRRDNRGFNRIRDDKTRDRSVSVESERKRQRNDSQKRRSISRDKRTRTKSRSPLRKKRRTWTPRYNVQIPKFTLNSFENEVSDLKKKFNALYIPSDFFLTRSSWQQTLPLDKPFNLDVPCKFHVFHRDVLPPKKPIPEPSDVDYLYSAKVILLASPGLEELYKKCIILSENQRASVSPDDDITIPAKLINFLIGQRSKEPVAIGGPWSPSHDGENPSTDPGVLIKTAIRSTKYQTGIDLSNCTQWLRFLEIHYTRAETVIKGKTVPARVETVVLFIPDVWSCLPTRPEWDELNSTYSKLLQRHVSNASDPDEKNEEGDDDNKSDDILIKKEPTHYSELDPKNMKVSDMRDELEARGLSPKGLKLQLIARLMKVIKQEADAEDQKENEIVVSDDELDYDKLDEDEEKDKEEEKEKAEMDEKEKARLEKLYKLPDTPHILVHPNTEFKSGKFSCITTSLYSLLNYRSEDNKEHSFELFLFAEMFNAMLNRDFTYNIYKSLCIYADKVSKEEAKEKEEKEKKKEKSKEDKTSDDEEKKDEPKKDKSDDSKREDKDKRDDKKNDVKEEKKALKPITADPHLLLSFVYFDNTMCGYINDDDLEDMLSNFCLSFSRAQVKKLVQKVITKKSLHYRKITDKTQEEIDEEKKNSVDLKALIHSNRDLLPKTDLLSGKSQAEKHNSGFVTYNGNVVDIGKLMTQLERNEASRLNTERLYNKLFEDNSALQCVYELSVKNVKDLTSELDTYKKRLSCSSNDLENMSAKVMRYVDTIFKIQRSIDPIIKENTPDDELTTSKSHETGVKKGKWEIKTEVDLVNETKVEVNKDKTNDKEGKVEEVQIKTEPIQEKEKVEDALIKTEIIERETQVEDKPKRVLEKGNKVAEKTDERVTKSNEEIKVEEKSNKADEKVTKTLEPKKEEEKEEEVVETKGEKMETEENPEEQEEEKKPAPKRRTTLKEGTPKRTPVKRATGTPKRKRN